MQPVRPLTVPWPSPSTASGDDDDHAWRLVRYRHRSIPEIGKTRVAVGLLSGLAQAGLTCVGMKPVASGCSNTAHGLRNDDAERLQASSTVETDYHDVNPYAFEPAVVPHLAGGWGHYRSQ